MNIKCMLFLLPFLFATYSNAIAGFDRWTAEVEENPFSKGLSVTVSNMSTIRSGILIMCDSSKPGVLVRAVPGFAYTDVLSLVSPNMQFAIDGDLLLSQTGETGSVGDNLAVAQVQLTTANSRRFVDAFMKAGRQIAVQDGISDRPHLMNARGSTKTGKILDACLRMQAPGS